MSTDLDVRIRAALVERKGQWLQIAASCDVSHSWISQFVRNKIPNPGYGTLKRLEALVLAPAAEASQAAAPVVTPPGGEHAAASDAPWPTDKAERRERVRRPPGRRDRVNSSRAGRREHDKPGA